MEQRYLNPEVSCKTIGPYEYYPDKVIGKRTNSILYAGRSLNTNKPICVKKVILTSSMDQKIAYNQIRVLRRFMHKNIIKYIDHIERTSFIYIVTQLFDMTLRDKIEKDGKFDEKLALETFLQILEGYQHLRNNGYIHRDIKPQNILYSGGTIKLADFGFSTLLRSVSFNDNCNVGTPFYMSPQVLNNNIYSQKSDIWSLGVTLYEMLSGNRPFMSLEELCLKRQQKKCINQLPCNPKIMKIIKKCLQYDVENRIQLQWLILDVKLTLNKVNLMPSLLCEKNIYIWENELNYIEFLEHIILLTKQCHKINPAFKQRCIFLIEFNIRMRIDLLENFKAKSQSAFSSLNIRNRFLKLKQSHLFQIQFPQKLEQNDRLNFFRDQNGSFKRSLQWQTQAQIKSLIKLLLDLLTHIRDEVGTIVQEHRVKLVDFLLTLFILNKMLIQKDNDQEHFLKQARLQVIMKSPCRVSFKTWSEIKAKAWLLRIM